VLLVTACSGGSGAAPRVIASAGPVDRLNGAVRAVAADRTAVLDALTAVQAGATALDAADEVCAGGDGVAARTAYRKAQPLTKTAGASLRSLPAALATYRSALGTLGAASVAVSVPARQALLRVVTSGRAEADAAEGFRVTAAGVWPRYEALAAAESTWITRAVTPWYRTQREGADAYVVLVEDARPALNAARARLGSAVTAVGGPIAAQAQVLSAADAALASVRAQG
jgi:hypothetical protein